MRRRKSDVEFAVERQIDMAALDEGERADHGLRHRLSTPTLPAPGGPTMARSPDPTLDKRVNPTLDRQTVTPALAARWLATSPGNRRLRRVAVESYAAAMKEGRWLLTHQAIAFDADGELLDGHHRLHAVIEAGVAIECYVARGCDRSTFAVIDSGRVRSVADCLFIGGEEHDKEVAAVANWIYQYELGVICSHASSRSPGNDVIVGVAREHPGIVESVAFIRKLPYVAPRSGLQFLHYYASRVAPVEMDAFMEGVCIGADLERGDPRLLLRTRFLGNRVGSGRLTRIELLALSIKAWNYFRSGRRMQQLVWRRRGQVAEQFPTIDLSVDGAGRG